MTRYSGFVDSPPGPATAAGQAAMIAFCSSLAIDGCRSEVDFAPASTERGLDRALHGAEAAFDEVGFAGIVRERYFTSEAI